MREKEFLECKRMYIWALKAQKFPGHLHRSWILATNSSPCWHHFTFLCGKLSVSQTAPLTWSISDIFQKTDRNQPASFENKMEIWESVILIFTDVSDNSQYFSIKNLRADSPHLPPKIWGGENSSFLGVSNSVQHFPKRWNGTKFFECCRQFPDYLKRGTPVLEFKVASHIVLPTCTWEFSIFRGGVDWPCQIWSSDCPGEVIISEREGKLSWSNQISNHPNLKSKLSMRNFHFEVGWWGGGANYVWSSTNILIPTVN